MKEPDQTVRARVFEAPGKPLADRELTLAGIRDDLVRVRLRAHATAFEPYLESVSEDGQIVACWQSREEGVPYCIENRMIRDLEVGGER